MHQMVWCTLLVGCGQTSPKPVPSLPPPGPPVPPPTSPPGPPPPSPAWSTGIAIVGTEVRTLELSGRDSFEVVVLRSDGSQVQPTEPISWSTSDSLRVTVSASGSVLASTRVGAAWVIASLQGLRDSVAVWVQSPEHEPSSFAITITYLDDGAPVWWRDALGAAARRWERVIRRPLPPVDANMLIDHCQHAENGIVLPPLNPTERGVNVLVRTGHTFPTGTYVEALGGDCNNRGLPFPTTVTGTIILNADHFALPPTAQRLAYVAHHELGHVLGLAGSIQGVEPWFVRRNVEIVDGTVVTTTAHIGTFGRFGYAMQVGHEVESVGVDNGGHWTRFFLDLMARAPSHVIGATSIGALMDLGYPAAWYGAGPY